MIFYRCRDHILYLLEEDFESNCGDFSSEFQAYNHPTLQKQNCYFSKLVGYYSCVKFLPKPVHLSKLH